MSQQVQIEVDGLDAMIAAFGRLEHLAASEVSARLDGIVREGFEEIEALVPTDAGDKRRPGGALKASGHAITSSPTDDLWTAEISFGTEDDTLPYASWAEFKSDVDWWREPTRAIEERIQHAIENAFEPD